MRDFHKNEEKNVLALVFLVIKIGKIFKLYIKKCFQETNRSIINIRRRQTALCSY